jgi:hypothetical protein
MIGSCVQTTFFSTVEICQRVAKEFWRGLLLGGWGCLGVPSYLLGFHLGAHGFS